METAPIGHLVLGAALVSLVAALVIGRRVWLVIGGFLMAVAVIVLGWAFVTNDFTVRAVAEHSRRGAAGPYRISGLWAGTAPSLLFWSAIATVIAAIAFVRPSHVRCGAGLVAFFAGTSLLAADPFARLALPPIDGGGLVPILEHPAMLIHPPLLYTGLLLTLPSFVDRAHRKRWLALAAAVLTVALGLGAWWSYAEQGWGGYWAWDPVENGGLLPWLAAVGALHVTEAAGDRLKTGLAMTPFVVAVSGTWLTRSGSAASVHAFADAHMVGLLLLVLVTVLIAATVAAISRSTPGGKPIGRARRLQLALVGITIGVVSIGTFAPVVRAALGGDRTAINGSFFGRLLAPVALVALGASMLVAVRSRTRSPAQLAAHVGFAVFIIGVAGTLAGRDAQVVMLPGETAAAAGRSVTFVGVSEPLSPRPGTRRVSAELRIDGVTLRPEFVVFESTGQLLAETATSRRWWGDVQAVMAIRSAAGPTVFAIHTAPLQSLVWLGALISSAGLLAAGIRHVFEREVG